MFYLNISGLRKHKDLSISLVRVISVLVMKIINYRNIPYDTVARLIRELIEKNVELDQLTMRVNEYVNKFNKCSNAEELVSKLKSLGLLEITSVMIANIAPKTVGELKALMNFEADIPPEDKLNEIIELVKNMCS